MSHRQIILYWAQSNNNIVSKLLDIVGYLFGAGFSAIIIIVWIQVVFLCTTTTKDHCAQFAYIISNDTNQNVQQETFQ